MAFWHHPASGILPLKRAMVLNRFLTSTDQGRSADAYWQFRESMGPGTITYNPKLVRVRQIMELYQRPHANEAITTFQSAALTAAEYLMEPAAAELYLAAQAEIGEMIIRSEREVISRVNAHEYRLTFWFDLDDYMTIHGLFDHMPDEQELMHGLVWVSQATIRL
jgi:hypothetical protein